MENTSIKDERREEILKQIDTEEANCLKTLKELRKKRLELTCNDPVEFIVSTIHKDRRGIILNLVIKVDKGRLYDGLKEEWRASAKATGNGWFGEIIAVGPKERLLSVLHKITRNGGTMIVDQIHKIEIPAPNKWWNYELEAILDEERELVKTKEKEEQK